jgi:hypothetical protein
MASCKMKAAHSPKCLADGPEEWGPFSLFFSKWVGET